MWDKMVSKCKCMRLGAIAFGVSLGIICGVSKMLFAWVAVSGYGSSLVDIWSAVYPGFSASFIGGIAGLAWGFLEGFVLGFLWAWLYNMCLCCCRCCCCKSKSEECKIP